jgi:hypothetical protein
MAAGKDGGTLTIVSGARTPMAEYSGTKGYGRLKDVSAIDLGAIALGHPLGATGARLILTLARELRARGVRYGIASACIGGGQGIAVLLQNPGA